MGLLSWLFPTEEDRIAKALLRVDSDPVEARELVLDLDRDDARVVLAQANASLVRKNLFAAQGSARQGDDHRVQTHMELVQQFHDGSMDEEIRAGRRLLREIRSERSASDQLAREQKQARQMAADPLGMTGGASWLDPQPDGGVYDPERDEVEARLALIIENYPSALQERVTELGAAFAKAVIDLEDGRADKALQVLLQLPDEEPLVRWERARCAQALRDPAAAAREIRAFAERASGHHDMGRVHSAELLAQLLTRTGQPKEALRVLRALRANEPERGGVLFAQLLEATGELKEAEHTLVELIRKHPRTQMLYALLARIRLRGGHRVQAMRALEASMEATCCTPGKCGYQPPSVDILRGLATLYLEDGIERERAIDLASQAFQQVEKPQWEDLYLRALVARAQLEPDAMNLAERLRQRTPSEDALRRGRLDTYLPA